MMKTQPTMRRPSVCTNIELFDEYTAKILGELYQAFPIKKSLEATAITGHTTLDDFGMPLNAQGKPSKHFDVCMATIAWLAEAGYMHRGSQQNYGFDECVLTAKGLEVLKSVPESLQASEGIGDKLVSALRQGAIDTAKDAAGMAIRAGIKMMME
jgi:hypothetical protein